MIYLNSSYCVIIRSVTALYRQIPATAVIFFMSRGETAVLTPAPHRSASVAIQAIEENI